MNLSNKKSVKHAHCNTPRAQGFGQEFALNYKRKKKATWLNEIHVKIIN